MRGVIIKKLIFFISFRIGSSYSIPFTEVKMKIISNGGDSKFH